jgi:glycosyltransferase involved in cell wall biosynthesis
MVSLIIPAWNEERMLAQTLPVLEQAARALPVRHETIVVDDASTDRTGRVAREHGGRGAHGPSSPHGRHPQRRG